MKITRFEDIIAWQKAQDLAVAVYDQFGTLKDWGFRDQIRRAAVSVSNNIAEGFERGTDGDFTRFLNIARASCMEVKSMLYLALRLRYIEVEAQMTLLSQSEEVSRIIHGFIQALKK